MGTTLTGTTPQDTYDSLIKVTDNGPLSGTAKYLSDGLGNDSALALSTTAVGIGSTTVNVSGFTRSLTVSSANSGIELTSASNVVQGTMFSNANGLGLEGVGSSGIRIFTSASGATTEQMRITAAGNVGIGTTAPESKLQLLDGDITVSTLNTFSGFNSTRQGIPSGQGYNLGRLHFSAYSTGTTYVSGGSIQAYANAAWSGSSAPTWLSFQTVAASSTSLVERLRIDSDGLKFNGDTAAANALDDYEEGTWTISASPSSSGTITLDSGVNAGSYTKIGRQVTVTGLAEVSAVSLPVGTIVVFSGLPFPISSRNLDYDSRIGGSVTVSSAGIIVPRAFAGFEDQSSFNVYVDASTIAAGNQFLISFTYIV